MKKIFTLLAMACVAFTGCTDEDSNSKYPSALTGDKIVFGASMNYESNGKQTRTVYGDKQTGKGGYTEIKWLEGDQVRIYCEQTLDATVGIGGVEGAAKRNYCDYTVAGDYVPSNTAPTDGQFETNHYVGLEASAEGDEGLCWGEGAHTFFGVYPSPSMLKEVADATGYADDLLAANAIKIEPDLVTAYLPNLQRPRQFVPYNANENLYEIHPAMRYAYMVAQQPEASATGNVDLVFKPIVTAVEMTLQNSGNANIGGVTMISLSSDKIISGDFTCNPGNLKVTNLSGDDSHKVVTIPVAADGSSITLAPGDRIKFTAFMVPGTDLNSITVTLVYANGVATKRATLSAGSDVKIVQAQKKNFITNVGVSFSNAVSGVELSEWMASIKGSSTISKLSIPAAGGAASGELYKSNLNNWNANETFLEQSLSIDELWAQGIRCFEFTVDKHATASGDLGSLNVRCNTVDCEITLQNAIKEVRDNLLAHPTEFAMVIITYQQNDGWDTRSQADNTGGGVTYARNPATFMSQLNAFWNKVGGTTLYGEWPVYYKNTVDDSENQIEIKTGVALYSPSMTLANARGKLFCIARPTSEYEDSYIILSKGSLNKISSVSYAALPSVSITNGHILVINGWGALKDKWEKRGYTTSAFFRGAEGNDAWKAISDNLKTSLGNNGKPGRPFDVSTKENDTQNTISDSYVDDLLKNSSLSADFTYTVNNSTGQASFNAWVQEWARVSDVEGSFYLPIQDTANPEYRDFFWANSTNEKFGNVTSTFDKALADQSGNTLYINSLCGYFIEKDILNSYLANSLTEMSGYWQAGVLGLGSGYYYRGLSGASNKAGMSGNISRFAQWMNNKFYNYLLTKNLGGNSTGIIMMDRVSSDATANPAGYYIPRIILANNPFVETTGQAASNAMRISLIEGDEAYDPETDMLASPEKR